jgi:hypothetical protein
MQEKELEGIMAAIILAGMMADRGNSDCRDQKILDAVRMAGALQSALADRGRLKTGSANITGDAHGPAWSPGSRNAMIIQKQRFNNGRAYAIH